MKKHWPQFAAFLVFTLGAFHTHAGTIFYVPIPASQSDASSGISTDNGYTSAVDGGNTRGTDRVINGITLYALSGNGQTSTADNCTLNALSGSLTNGGGTTESIQLDGTFREVSSDMTFNNGAGDNSQQEIVLAPESLEAGTTYDLRVYICNGSGQNRQVNLAFVGDGQAAVETGFFNEDDARTSAGGFKDQNQAYYINYRYTWDGDSTPGITITQKSGGAPFCLYALTNQVVPGGTAAAPPAAGSPAAGAATAGEEAAPATGGEEGLSAGYTNENQESDQIGVSSDDFYGSESLNAHGKWVKLAKWGTAWQPTDVQSGWSPYTNGNFQQSDNCGWTFVSDEPWAWACYHYGRWCKVQTGCGWAWVPGKVWASSWVSWRRGRDGAGCSCIGWAPLPPEAGCEFGVGISTWVDNTYNIGPDCYTFINIRDFGSESYSGCGCIYDHGRNATTIIDTFNCTNISHTRWGTYCGGPDYNWCNTEIRKRGGKECGKVYVNRYDNPGKMGGKSSKHEGNQLALLSPQVKGDTNPKHMPKTAESIGANKIDHGWNNVKDPKVKNDLKNKIAQESKGKTPQNSKATLPPDVAQKMLKHKGGGQAAGGAAGGNAALQGSQLGVKGQHPGKGNKGLNTQNLTTGGQTGAGAGAFDQHPGSKGKGKGQGQFGNTATGAGSTGAAGGSSAAFNQHPGGKGHKGQNANSANALGNQGTGAGGAGGGNSGVVHHPGQSFKKSAQGGPASTGGSSPGGGTGAGLGQGGGKHKGKGQTGNQAMTQGATGQGGTGAATGQGGTTGGQGGGKHKGKGQTGNQAMTQGGTGQGGTGGTGQGSTGQGGTGQGGGKHKGKSSQTNNQVLSQRGTGQGGGGGGGGQSQMHHNQQLQQQKLQQQQLQHQKLQQQQLQQQKLQQQRLQQQQLRQQQLQQQQRPRKKPTPAPYR